MFDVTMTPQRPSITATAPPAEEGGERIDAGEIFVDRGPVSGVVLSVTRVSYGAAWTFTFEPSGLVECPRWEYVQCGKMRVTCDKPPVRHVSPWVHLEPDGRTSGTDPSFRNQFDALNGIVMVDGATIEEPWDHELTRECKDGRVHIEWEMRTYIVCKHADRAHVIGYIDWKQEVIFHELGENAEETRQGRVTVRLNADEEGNPLPLTFAPTPASGDPEYRSCVSEFPGW